MRGRTVLRIGGEGDETHPGGVGITNCTDLIVVTDLHIHFSPNKEFDLLKIWRASDVTIAKIYLLKNLRSYCK